MGGDGRGKNLNCFLGRRNPKREIFTIFHTYIGHGESNYEFHILVSLQVRKHGLCKGLIRVFPD